MATTIITKEQQAKGSFDGGTILENKPIGFPRDGGEQKRIQTFFIGQMHGRTMVG